MRAIDSEFLLVAGLPVRIAILSELDTEAVAQLRDQHDVVDAVGIPQERVEEVVADSDVVVFRSGVQLTRSVVEAAARLRLVVRAGSGYDNIDLDAARARGVVVARVPGPSSRAVAELTLGLMFAASRNIVRADSSMRRGEWAKSELAGNLIFGKTAGVVGLGNIGSITAELCQSVGMRVVGCLPAPSQMTVRRFASKGIELLPLSDLLAVSDYVTLHVPLDASTRGLIDEAELGQMKPGSYLINTSRGGVVYEAALLQALHRPDGLRGAALDTHESEGAGRRSPLADEPNVVLTPHIGSMAVETQAQIGGRVVELIDGLVAGTLETLLSAHERVA